MKHGFSLVELSIVLVILGLLTGGILAGQNLIRASELRAVTAEYNGYITAAQTFRDKYFAIPGDMRNATNFWGAATCPAGPGTGTATCDGDGNGTLTINSTPGQFAEQFTFWQHLANAGLIEGSYTGESGATGVGQDSIVGENVPRSRVSNAGWYVADAATSGSALFDAAVARNNMHIGAQAGTTWPRTAIFSPEEAWNIDTKMDDGRPGYGGVTGSKQGSTVTPNCTTTAVESTSEYALTTTGNQCILMMDAGF